MYPNATPGHLLGALWHVLGHALSSFGAPGRSLGSPLGGPWALLWSPLASPGHLGVRGAIWEWIFDPFGIDFRWLLDHYVGPLWVDLVWSLVFWIMILVAQFLKEICKCTR